MYTPPPDSPITFTELVRARLLAVLSVRDVSVSIASKMLVSETGKKRAAAYLCRKLLPQKDGRENRPLKFSDVEELLAALGVGAAVLFAPVLGPGDLDVLRWVGSTTRPSMDGASAVFAGLDKAIPRLESQGLLRRTPTGFLKLTEDGVALLPVETIADESAA